LPLTDEQFAAWVAERTQAVEERLRTAVHTPYAFAETVARYLIDAGGKMYRPALAIAAAGLGTPADRDDAGLTDAATVVELTHVASLYHDDVMDEADRRRGLPSVHVRWDNSVAILTGDFMLAQASLLGARLGEAFMTSQAGTLSRLVQGQIAELRGPEPGADPVAHHLAVVANKTAALIAAAARYGGMFAGLGSDAVAALAAYGQALGMAFQLADDLMDIASEDSGKACGTDLREGVPTLATLLVRDHPRPADGRLVELLSAPVSEADLPEALGLLRVHPALDEARAEIRRWAGEAATYLTDFADGPAKRTLTELAEQAVGRTA
jgi:heptaprenyl diphosphate synthase